MQLRIENEVIYVTVIVTIKLNTYLILNNILSKFRKAIVIHVYNVSDYKVTQKSYLNSGLSMLSM